MEHCGPLRSASSTTLRSSRTAPSRELRYRSKGQSSRSFQTCSWRALTTTRLIPGVEPALLATTGAWAVFGAARMWHQTPDRIPAEEMAAKIEAMVKPIFLNSFG
jgi:hypothetical protein